MFNLGIIQGARAVHIRDQTGSLAEGKLADIVNFDGSSPGMVCGTEQDLIIAAFRYLNIRDVETGIINGVVRKEAGRLLLVEAGSKIALGGEKQLALKRCCRKAGQQSGKDSKPDTISRISRQGREPLGECGMLIRRYLSL